MELTRRDALAALASGGAASVAGCAASPTAAVDDGSSESGVEFDVDVLDAVVAVAEVLYPSEVSGVEEFVETCVLGRTEGRDDYRAGLEAAVTELDAVARDWEGAGFVSLDVTTRDRLLRDFGVDAADPAPGGSISGRLRYYVGNDLLFALYSSPTGGRLVGIENPVGYPGGTRSYQRASMPGDDG